MALEALRSRWIGLARTVGLVAALLSAALLTGCGGGSVEAEASDVTQAADPSVLWFAAADGATILGDRHTEAASIPDTRLPAPPSIEAFVTRPGNGGRQIAYDRAHERLWYSDDHAGIASIELRSGEPGPALGPFSDIALWGCAVGGRARTFAVDERRNRLLVSSLGGGLLGYDLDTLELVSGIGPSQLGDVAFDFRRLAIDEASDTLWFSTVSGAIAAMDLGTERLTGATVAIGGVPRSISVDASGGSLLVLEADQLHVVDLETFVVADELAPAGAVALTWVSG